VTTSTAEPPPLEGLSTEPSAVHRTFGFSDICGFTAFLEREGPHAAVDLLTSFRSTAREVAARRGVRIAKWLGDGVMFVSVETAPLIATAVELTGRLDTTGLHLRSGVTTGPCLLFEADDYIGHPVNLAARLCDLARPGEVLADENTSTQAPPWVAVGRPCARRIPGVGRVSGICRLALEGSVHVTA
jgi:class 3 adenylate cyclase